MSQSTISNRAVIVPASAGSGKTFRIAHEYIYDVLRNRYTDSGEPYFDRSFYKRILAVTFTNKATEEMKSRILSEIHRLASGKSSGHLNDLIAETGLDEKTLRSRAKIVRSLILHDYSHFTVLTNDTFFQRILRAFIRELGIDMNFTTELDTAPVLTKSVDALISNITENKELRRWLEELTEERIRDGARWDIRSAIGALNSELFKESTKDIIANSKDKASLKKSIDDFSSAVEKRGEELKAKGEAALNAIASRGYSHDNFKSKFTKIFEKVANGSLDKWTDSQLRHLSNDTVEWFNKNKATPDLLALAESLQEMLNDIHICHIEFKTLENTHRLISRNYRGFALLRDLQKNVEDICRQENSMLLSETKHAIAGFISESEAPFIYEKVGNYFDKFMIDEFQDTSVKEWNNFLPLLRNAMAQSTDTSVLIVGDVKQSIYRWRGGDWRILGGQIERELPDSKSKPLENNWRSLPNIVEFNTELFNAVVERENSRMNTQLDEAFSAGRLSGECKSELYDTIARAYASHKQTARRKHKNCGYISIVAHPEDADKDSIIFNKDGLPLYIERITEVLKKGFLPRDITILVRKNADGVRIAEELLHYREFLPKELWFDITTEEALSLASSPAVELIIAILRLAIDRKDATSLALYNHLHNNDHFDTQLDEEDNAFLDSIRMMSPEDAFEHITIRYADDLEGQTAYVLALHEQIVRFSAGRVADISLFEKWWSEKGAGLSVRVERSDRAIEILTIHKAKGLENKVIIMPHSSWTMDPISSTGAMTNIVWSKPAPNQHLTDIGEFPISFSSTVGESLFADAYFREVVYSCVDALNMLYVATTRAGEQLHIFLPPRAQRGYTVGNMLLDIYGSRLQQEVGENYRHYQIGTFDGPEIKEESSGKDEKVVATSVITTHSASPVKLKLNTSLSRYFAEEDGGLSPRSMGILLHRAFEGASTREEIFAVLDEMALNGELGGIELPAIKAQISNTLDTTVAGEWFDGSWGELRRECSIIRPKAKTKRPDRVMTRGKEAVVLDYKFGEEMDSHHKQIAEYMAILRNMGYTSVKGYLWYVTTGKIKTVEG